MAYELVKPQGEEGNNETVDPRDRKDWDKPSWAKVGTEDWHKQWMNDSDSGYLDAFHAKMAKMDHTYDQYKHQLSTLPTRKEELRKEKNNAWWNVIKFAFVIPVGWWVVTQMILEFSSEGSALEMAHLVAKILAIPIVVVCVFFLLPASGRDLVECQRRYNILNYHALHQRFRDNNNVVSFAEEEQFLHYQMKLIDEFRKKAKREKLDTTAAGEDYVFLDEMSDRQKEVLHEMDELAEFKDHQARSGDFRKKSGYEWIIIGFGILFGTLVLIVVFAGIRMSPA